MTQNTKSLLKTLRNILTNELDNPLLYLVHYGSKEPDKDIYLFAVYRYEPNYYEYQIGKLDLFAVSIEQLHSMLKNHDILASEPLLTGTILAGDLHSWGKIKQGFLKSKPDLDSIYFLYSRALEMINTAFRFIQRYKDTASPTDANRFWKNISFAVGYMSFGIQYREKIFPLTCKQVLATCPDFDNTMKQFRTVKDSAVKPSVEDMQKSLKLVKKQFIMLVQK